MKKERNAICDLINTLYRFEHFRSIKNEGERRLVDDKMSGRKDESFSAWNFR